MKYLLSMVAFVFFTQVNAQTKVGGVVIPNVMKTNGKYLKLNGAGIREKMFLDLYVGSLYMETKTSDANTIINSDKLMAIKLTIISGLVTKENMEEAIREGFDKSTNGNITAIKTKIDDLIKNGFASEIVKGDVFDLVYLPGTGTTLSKNNKALLTIKGLDFKKALFGIWFCDEPADETLKKKMLGK